MAGSFSDSHPILVEENRPDMQTRTGGGTDSASGPGLKFPDPDMIRGIPLATMGRDEAAFINLGLEL
jgi:hypothetical protein